MYLGNIESDVNLNICKFDRVLSHLVPNEGESPRRCGQDDQAMKEASEGRGPAEHKCDLSPDVYVTHVSCWKWKGDANLPKQALFELHMKSLWKLKLFIGR